MIPLSIRRHLVTAIMAGALIGAAALALPAYAEPRVFELSAPDARQVFLAGEMTNWSDGKVPMRKDADGRWRATIDLDPGQWLYKFVVDGKWIADPGSSDRDADGSGGQHSFLFVGPGDWQVRPDIPRGHVDTAMVPSGLRSGGVKVNVYLPPGFERGKPYPVLWLLHGGNMDADQWFRTGHVQRYMDNMLAREAIRPFVIVMPSDATSSYAGGSERFITGELPGWLQQTYGLRVDRRNSGVAGMSMGGYGAFRLAYRHPDLYGFAISLSGYFSDSYIASLPKQGTLPMQTVLRCGDKDDLVTTNRKLVKALHAGGADFSYREDPGAHTWHYWSLRMVEMLTAADAYFTTGRLPMARN
jgi:enterochelin esterase-like enzyme